MFDIETISSVWLFALGGALLVCELFIFSYYLLFIAVGVVFTGILTACGVLESPAVQLLSIVICSIIALFTLRPLLKKFFKRDESYVENANLKLKPGTKARVVENGIIECNGTMWKADTSGFAVDEVVKIVDFRDDAATIAKT